MIAVFLFYIHLIFGLYVFTKRWQEEGLSAAFLILIFVGIIFSVGWTLSYLIASLIFPTEGLGKFYNRDTISLTIVTIFEYFFYNNYFRGKLKKEKAPLL